MYWCFISIYWCFFIIYYMILYRIKKWKFSNLIDYIQKSILPKQGLLQFRSNWNQEGMWAGHLYYIVGSRYAKRLPYPLLIAHPCLGALEFYRYRFVICWFYLILQAGAFKWQFFFNNYWFWCFYPIKEYAFLSLLRTSGNMESSSGCQHKQVYL